MAKQEKFGKRLLASMTEFAVAMETGDIKRLTIRKVSFPPEPKLHSPKSVLSIRERLNISQAVFARLLGVSLVLAQAWEQGNRKPSKLACRLLDEIDANPDYWRRKLRAA